eukprot:TRINITY_DN76794_c0_g1_i1.p1 TRINITY_DN76794_c0_g1~~TRINITY_DN76794_c0_g1_i1.p1  ORF type:complete len:1528 (+),score=506.88 TRINITY_DN76794_c0_g1_i1:85-4668(+)
MPPKGKKRFEDKPLGKVEVALKRCCTKAARGERVLSLLGSGSNQTAGDEGAAQLAEAVAEGQLQPGPSVSLKSLTVRENGVGDEGAYSLAYMLAGSAGEDIKTLDLGSNKIGNVGAGKLAKALGTSCSLQLLDLSSNCFGDEAVEALARVLSEHKQLEELQMGGNTSVSSKGLMALAGLAAKHPKLKTLGIGSTNLSSDNTSPFISALGQSRTLVCLQLPSVGLADEGATALAEVLPKQQSLRELWLSDNKVEDVGALALAEALKKHGQLRLLALDKNQITDKGIMDFVHTLLSISEGRDLKDITCFFGGNPTKRFNEDTLNNLSVAAKTARLISKRAVMMEMMLKFWKDFTGIGAIDGDAATTQKVVKDVVIPESILHGACYAEFHHTFLAEFYVVHSWHGLFGDLLRGIATHASGFTEPSLDPFHEQYNRRPEALTKRYFVDVFCIDQAKKYPEGDPRCETDKFDFVMSELSKREVKVLVTMDREYVPMTRTWCITEVHHAHQLEMPLLVSFGPIRPMPRRRKNLSVAETEASLEVDSTLLLGELELRGLGTKRKFESTIMTPLQKQAIETYKAIYETMPQHQKDDCDWVKAKDNAREDMKQYDEEGNAEKLREAVQAGEDSAVEEETMIPRRRRLAQLELIVAVEAENVPLLQDIAEMERTLGAAEEQKLDDPPLFRRGREKITELYKQKRRDEGAKALRLATTAGNSLVLGWEKMLKAKKKQGLILFEVPFLKDPDDMSPPEKAEEKRREDKFKEEMLTIKKLRWAGVEAIEADCPEEPVKKGLKTYAELRVHSACQHIVRRIGDEQAAERAAIKAERLAAEKAAREQAKEEARAAKLAAKQARIKEAEERGEEYESEGDDSDVSELEEEEAWEEEEDAPEEESVEPEDVEDGSVEMLVHALKRGREEGARDESRDFGKNFLETHDREVFLQCLRDEMAYFVEQRSADDLRRIIGQVVDAGLGKGSTFKAEAMSYTVSAIPPALRVERPGVRQHLPGGYAQADAVEQAQPEGALPELAATEQAPPEQTPEQTPEQAQQPPEQALPEGEAVEPPETLQEKLEEAADADQVVDPDQVVDTDQATDADQVLEACEEATAPQDQASKDGADIVKARTRLAYLVMFDAIQARDLKLLLEVVPEAMNHNVEESEVEGGWRTIRELELLNALKEGDIKVMRKTLKAAREAGVQDDIVIDAQQKLSLKELKVGMADRDSQMLSRALDEGQAAGLTDKQLFQGKNFYVSLEVTRTMFSNSIPDLQRVMALALEVGMQKDSKDLVVARTRLATLQLVEATEGSNLVLLKERMEAAKEENVDRDKLLKARFKLSQLELLAATSDFDPERLKDAMYDAKSEGVDKSLFEPAKKKLKDIFPKALTEWMVMELEEATAKITDASPSAPFKALIAEAKAAGVETEDSQVADRTLAWLELHHAVSMTDQAEIERIIAQAKPYGWYKEKDLIARERHQNAVDRLNELIRLEKKAEAEELLKLTMMSDDIMQINVCIEEATKHGCDEELIKAAKAKVAEYS